MAAYPLVGFHFLVRFELSPEANDTRFQEVTGLDVELETESFVEGGQNRFTWQLPKRSRYSEITLKRGLLIDSLVTRWCKNALENFTFAPANLQISLLNEEHMPVLSWYVVHAIPRKWSVSGLNAQDNSLMIESLTLTYHYFNVNAS